MKKFMTLAFLAGALLVADTAGADIYQYIDDTGQVRYTNDLSSVPVDKQGAATRMPETPAQPAPSPRPSGPVVYPLLENLPSSEELARKQAREERRIALEAEYQRLLKEKKALDDDRSFQKRRIKRKYQNRPYIKEMVAREAAIAQRLAEIEHLLQAYR